MAGTRFFFGGYYCCFIQYYIFVFTDRLVISVYSHAVVGHRFRPTIKPTATKKGSTREGQPLILPLYIQPYFMPDNTNPDKY